MRDRDGIMLPNAHLVGMFRRIVKLLFWRIRPIFVFDGAAPHLKKLTTQRRRAQERQSATEAALTVNKLLRNKLKQRALAAVAEAAAANSSGVVAAEHDVASTADTQSALDETASQFPRTPVGDGGVVVVSSPDAVVVSDDIELSRGDDDPTYDTTEAQELLAAYNQMTDANGTALADIDADVLANLDERVQLEFLLGLRQLQRRETRHRISDLADTRSSTVHDPRQFSELQVTALLGRANIARHERAVRERLSHVGGQRMVSDANTVLIFESDDEKSADSNVMNAVDTEQQRPTQQLVAGAGFFVEDDDDEDDVEQNFNDDNDDQVDENTVRGRTDDSSD
jgi:hypothetical protein